MRKPVLVGVTVLALLAPLTLIEATAAPSVASSARLARARALLAGGNGNGASVGGTSSGRSSMTVLGDFDNNGKDDLAVPVIGEDDDAGAVHIIYGGGNGLAAGGNQFITQNDIDTLASEADDVFGSAIAAGDLNGDGFDDLAIGSPGEDNSAGLVVVLDGTPNGIDTSEEQILTQASAGLETPEPNDRFGHSLAIGRFNTGNIGDLAIGTPYEDFEGPPDLLNAGWVGVLYGTQTDLSLNDETMLVQGEDQLTEDFPETDDHFGYSLAAGQLGHSGQHDLAVGVPGESVTGGQLQGAVHVFYGTNVFFQGDQLNGLTILGDQLWTQNSDGIKDSAEAADVFGYQVAIGNLGKTSHGDLAVSAALEGKYSAEAHGAVAVLYGTNNGVSAGGNQLFSQDSPGVLDKTDHVDLFGASLAIANYGRTGLQDLAIGALAESFGSGATTKSNAGAVHVLYGTSKGVSGNGSQYWTQDSPGIANSPESGDTFGVTLTPGNFGKTTHNDLAIGTLETLLDDQPGEILSAGAVHVLYGSSTGLRSNGSQFWTQNALNDDPNGAEDTDKFGTRSTVLTDA